MRSVLFDGDTHTVGFLLVPDFSMIAFAASIEPLRLANRVSGKPLWRFQANASWRASPMTYMFDGAQYIAVAAGGNIIALAIK